MEQIRRFLLESHYPSRFVSAVYEALSLLEAVNINKSFLIKTAGSPERFADAKKAVQEAWAQAGMQGQLNQKTEQRVLNFLYLMEIRSPGFTDTRVLQSIHDLALDNLLDTKVLAAVNSDTSPEHAKEIIMHAVSHAERNAKVYPDLTEEEEAIWNRVRVYHEFPDGFKWVYAIDGNGKITGSIPSSITSKTMHHCGNDYGDASKNDQYFELRGPDGKAYLTVILTPDGKIQESKSWGNQPNQYRQMIQPYVKWFFNDKVTGVTDRYNYGYATHNNFGVKDFIGDDPEFVEDVVNNRPELLGSNEGKILFLQHALADGIVTVDQLKRAYAEGWNARQWSENVPGFFEYAKKDSRFGKFAGFEDITYKGRTYRQSVFSENGFAVLCAVCGGCPFSKDELKKLVANDELSLAEFANYNIRLLDDEMQREFVKARVSNFDTLQQIASQVDSFSISEEAITGLLEPFRGDSEGVSEYSLSSRAETFMDYLITANPPEKVHRLAKQAFSDGVLMQKMCDVESSLAKERIPALMQRFTDLELTPELVKAITKCLTEDSSRGCSIDAVTTWAGLGDRGKPVLSELGPARIIDSMSDARGRNDVQFFIDRAKLYRSLSELDSSLTVSGEELNHRMMVKNFDLIYKFTTDDRPETRAEIARQLAEAIMANGKDILGGEVVHSYGIRWKRLPDDEMKIYLYLISKMADEIPELPTGVFSAFVTCDTVDMLKFKDNEARPYSDKLATRFTSDMLAFFANGIPSGEGIEGSDAHLFLAEFEWLDHFSEIVGIPSRRDCEAITNMMHNVLEVGVTDSGKVDEWQRSIMHNPCVGHFIVRGLFRIPFEDWGEWRMTLGNEEFMRSYVTRLPVNYIMESPSMCDEVVSFVTGQHTEGSADAFIDPSRDLDDIIDAVNSSRYGRGGTKFANLVCALLSKKVKSGALNFTAKQLTRLRESGLLNPEAFRVGNERAISNEVNAKPEGTRVRVEMDLKMAERYVADVKRLAKSPNFPDIAASVLDYLVGEIYANLGNGRVRWKVDENASRECQLVGYLFLDMEHLANNYYVQEAYREFEREGLIDALKGFDQANTDACNGNVTSKFKCIGRGDIKLALNNAANIKSICDLSPAPVPAPKKTRKKKAEV